jgi:O-antigen/teichoic acid export membrane protein
MFGRISLYSGLGLLTVVFGLGSTYMLTRILSVEVVGKYFTFTYLYYLFEKIFNANTPTAFVFFKKVDRTIHSSLFSVDGMLYFVGGLSLFFAYNEYGFIISTIAMLSMFSGIGNFIIGHYKYEDKFVHAGTLELIPVLLRFVSIFFFYVFSIANFELLIYMFLISYLVSNGVRIYLANYHYSLQLILPRRELIYYTLNVSLINSVKNIPRNVDVLLIGMFFNNALVGPYKVAKDIGNAFLISMDPMFSVLFSDFRKNLNDSNRSWLLYSVVSTLFGIFVLLVWLIVGPGLIRLLWGDSYTISMNFSLYIMGFSLVAVFNNPLGAFLLSKGQERLILFSQIISLCTTFMTWSLAIHIGSPFMIPVGLFVYKLTELFTLLLLKKWKSKT